MAPTIHFESHHSVPSLSFSQFLIYWSVIIFLSFSSLSLELTVRISACRAHTHPGILKFEKKKSQNFSMSPPRTTTHHAYSFLVALLCFRRDGVCSTLLSLADSSLIDAEGGAMTQAIRKCAVLTALRCCIQRFPPFAGGMSGRPRLPGHTPACAG